MKTYWTILWWINFLNGILALVGYYFFGGKGFLIGAGLSSVNMFIASYWIDRFTEVEDSEK